MSRWWCCCGCRYFWDPFSRDEGDTELGDRWTVESGTWTVEDGTLRTADSDALAVANKEEPGGNLAMVASVCMYLPDVGDQGRLVFNFEDASNYCYAQVTVSDATHLSLAIFQVVASAHGEIGVAETLSRSGDDWYSLRLCLFDGRVAVECSGECEEEITTWIDPDRIEDLTIESTTAGLGTGTQNGSVEFDAFALHRHNSIKEGCPQSGQTCGQCSFSGIIPPEMVADLGVGGLINAACNKCDEIAGPFAMQHIGSCQWRFGEWLCSRMLNIALEINSGVPGEVFYVVYVTLWYVGGPGGNYAFYESDVFDGEDCRVLQDDEGKIQLHKTLEAWSWCGGSLPETISIWEAP